MVTPDIQASVAYASFAVFGAAGLLYLIGCINEWYKSTARAEEMLIRYSKKILCANFFTVFFLIVSNVALILEQGFFQREAGVYIWWPRSIAYALAFSTLSYTISQVLMVRKRESEVASKAAFLFIVCAMVLGSFTASDDFHWIYFGLSFVPLIFLLSVWFFRSRRDDRDGVYTIIAVSTVMLLAGYAITWGLSPAGSGSAPSGDSVITMNTAFWIYFALDVAFYVVLPIFCLVNYIPYIHAVQKVRSAVVPSKLNKYHSLPQQSEGYGYSGSKTTIVQHRHSHPHHSHYHGVLKHTAWMGYQS